MGSTAASDAPSRKRRSVLGNFMSLGVSSILGSVVALAATAYLARTLGVETFGSFNLARTYVDYAIIPTTLGITVTASRSIAASDDGMPRLAGTVIALRLILGVVFAAALGILGSLFLTGQALVALGAMLACVPLTAANVDWLYSAHEDQRWPGVVRTAGRVLYAALIFLLVSSPENLKLAGWSLTIEAAFVAVLMFVGARSWISFSRSAWTDFAAMWRHVKASAHVGAAGLAQRLKTNADLLILGAAGTAAAVGYYAAAYRLVLFVNALAGLYATVILPRVARSSEHGDSGEFIGASTRLTFAVAAAISAGGAAVGSQAVVALMGDQYAPSGPATAVLLAASGFIVIGLSLGYIAVALGKAKPYGRIVGSAAVVNIAVNVLAIPVFGFMAAAWVTLATEVAIAVALCFVVWSHGLREALTPSWMARLAAVASVVWAVPAFLVARDVSVWFAVGAGTACWFAGVLGMRLLGGSDISLLVKGGD